MHILAISEAVRERVRTRTGKLHPFDAIEPRRSALLVIDMQNYFVKPGHQGETPMARRIVPTSTGSPPDCANAPATSSGSATAPPGRARTGRPTTRA